MTTPVNRKELLALCDTSINSDLVSIAHDAIPAMIAQVEELREALTGLRSMYAIDPTVYHVDLRVILNKADAALDHTKEQK